MVATLAELRAALAHRSGWTGRKSVVSTGIEGLDRILPGGGLTQGGLVEWLAEPGCGSATLASFGLTTALGAGKSWCVVDGSRTFVGGSLPTDDIRRRCLVAHPEEEEQLWWAVEQSLRCSGIGLTWVWADRVPDRVIQRWQVAAEKGGGIGAVFRTPEAARRRSWADVRFGVVPVPSQGRGRRLQVSVIYCRGQMAGQSVTLELHDATHSVCVVPELAGSTASRRTAKVS